MYWVSAFSSCELLGNGTIIKSLQPPCLRSLHSTHLQHTALFLTANSTLIRQLTIQLSHNIGTLCFIRWWSNRLRPFNFTVGQTVCITIPIHALFFSCKYWPMSVWNVKYCAVIFPICNFHLLLIVCYDQDLWQSAAHRLTSRFLVDKTVHLNVLCKGLMVSWQSIVKILDVKTPAGICPTRFQMRFWFIQCDTSILTVQHTCVPLE